MFALLGGLLGTVVRTVAPVLLGGLVQRGTTYVQQKVGQIFGGQAAQPVYDPESDEGEDLPEAEEYDEEDGDFVETQYGPGAGRERVGHYAVMDRPDLASTSISGAHIATTAAPRVRGGIVLPGAGDLGGLRA